ncbi:MAG: hypothetical protein IBX61_05980 [Thermoleophilia bacterium]|nr:hypothetical protein [Thermoleophilia bacterium]
MTNIRAFLKWCVMAAVFFLLWQSGLALWEKNAGLFIVYIPVIPILLVVGILVAVIFNIKPVKFSLKKAATVGAAVGLLTDVIYKLWIGWLIASSFEYFGPPRSDSFWISLADLRIYDWIVVIVVSIGGSLSGAVIFYGLVRSFGSIKTNRIR